MRTKQEFAFLITAAITFAIAHAFQVAAKAQTGEASRTSDWPGFLGPHRNGKSDEHGLPASFPTSGPPVVWQKPVGTGYAAPAISGDRLFHFARFGDNARLSCLNARTGAEIWKSEYPTEY